MAIDCIEQLRHDYLQQYGQGIPQGLLVTPTEEMRDNDWPDEFKKWNVGMEGLTTVCYASLSKEDLTKYDFYVYDECHRLTVHNLERIRDIVPNKPRLGLTATFPKTKFEDETERVELMEALLPPIHTVTTDEAVDLELISDFEVLVLKFNLDLIRLNIPCGTKKNEMRTEQTQYKKLSKRLAHAMYSKDPKTAGMKFSIISKRMNFVYNLPSKTRLSKQVLDSMHVKGKRTVVFAGSIEQANQLCGEFVYHSKSSDKYLIQYQNKEIDLIGCVKALNEGKNLTEPDQALIIQVDSVDRNLVQRIGRIIRKRYNNPTFKARIVILVALGTADEKWYKSSIIPFQTKRIKEYIVKVPD